MTDIQNFTLSIEDENEPAVSGHVNYSHEFTESPESGSTTEKNLQKLKTNSPKSINTVLDQEIIADSKENKTDEWWNHVNSLVKSDEAVTSENNNCISKECGDEEGLSQDVKPCSTVKEEPDPEDKARREKFPEENTNFLSRLTFWWFNGLVITAYKRPIGDADLWALREPLRASYLAPRLKSSWVEEQRKCYHGGIKGKLCSPQDTAHDDSTTSKQNAHHEHYAPPHNTTKARKPNLLKAIFKMLWQNFLLAAIFKVLFDIVLFIQPQLLNLLIKYVEDKNNKTGIWKGYVFSIAMFLTGVIQSALLEYHFHIIRLLEIKIKSAIIGLIYEKALVLNSASRRQSTAGEMVTLMSVDAARLSLLVNYVTMLWSGPLEIAVAIYFLSVSMGISVLAGIGILILLIPLNLLISRLTRKQQIKQMLKKDSRIVIMDEVLSGIKALKLYAWEEYFLNKVMQIRNHELKYLRKASCLNAVTEFTFTCAPFLFSFAMFGVYVLTGNEMTASKAIVALSLINIIRIPFTGLPTAIVTLVQALVSVKRITEFLNLDEVNPNNIQRSMPEGNSGSAVYVQNGLFSWDKDELPVLEDINMDIPSGSLVAVVGPVGSGKSSLLSALLGETEKLKGLVAVEGSVAYVPQQAWMQNATLRDNITFGKPFNQKLYQKVLDACALKTDLEILPGGDMTEIGERGINLSGGQKQRISLACAAYFNADVYFLDDALSAVDAHVGKHIFEEVIGPKGILRTKTRVLVTHNVSFLPQVDKIIVLKDGTISEEGTYAELMASGGDFSEFVTTYTAKQQRLEQEEQRARGYTYLEEIHQMDKEGSEVIDETEANISSHTGNGYKEEEKTGIEGNDQQSEIELAEKKDGVPPSTSIQDLEEGERSRSHTVLESIQENENEDIEDDGHSINPFTDKTASSGSNLETRRRKQVITPKFLSIPNGTGDHIRERSWTLPASPEAQSDVFKRHRSRTTLESNTNLEKSEQLISLWIPKNSNRDNGHCERMRKISYMRGRPRQMSRFRSDTVTSIKSWQDFEIDERSRRKRASSRLSTVSIVSEDVDYLSSVMPFDSLAEAMTSKEVSQEGTVKLSVFLSYIKSSTCWLFVSFLLFLLFAECWSAAARIWLAHWSSSSTTETTATQHTRDLGLYGGLGFSQAVFVLLACFVQAFSSVKASDRLHHGLLTNVLHSPMAFFEATPLGRIVNRFSKDIDMIDDLVPRSLLTFLRSSLELLAAIVIISFAMPLFLSVILPLGLLYTFIQITRNLSWMVRKGTELESSIVSVERVKEYSETAREAEWIIPEIRPPETWPQNGNITFKDFDLRYREGLPLVLKSINCLIEPGEKIGIVGRTGAGKSTLTQALFRILERAGGQIVIDDIDIATIGLQDLRSRLTIIPQDPVLFSGTLRLNLDPLGRHTDEELLQILEASHLKRFAAETERGLQFIITEGGDNLSLGERQLVCLARALLRKGKILILDEATSALDLETDELIQQTIRREFADCTVFTIAHRLNTIMDYSRIMVLDKGVVVEFDTPLNLLAQKGIFYSMAQEAGIA
ncbi:ATP-binding cassette sub-family C member 3-like [Oculina patagonica]